MNTEEKTAAQTAEQRKAQRKRQLWLWRRRMFSLFLLGLATLAALISIIIAIVFPEEEPETAPSQVSAPTVSFLSVTPDPDDAPESDDTVHGPPGDLSLVNADHPWSFPESTTLANIYENRLESYNVRDTGVLLEQRIIDPLNRMLADFDAVTGCEDLLLCAGYRTLEDQQYLWDRSMETQGQDHTQSYIATPGASEHHTGLAVDFSLYDVGTEVTYDFDGSGDSAWILDHCWEYGFIQRYPPGKANITGISTEPWHFRYVGFPHAYLMHENSLCLEEYIQFLQDYPYDGTHLTADWDGKSYEIWCCPETDIQYPEQGDYTVSGDNCGSVIITAEVP